MRKIDRQICMILAKDMQATMPLLPERPRTMIGAVERVIIHHACNPAERLAKKDGAFLDPAQVREEALISYQAGQSAFDFAGIQKESKHEWMYLLTWMHVFRSTLTHATMPRRHALAYCGCHIQFGEGQPCNLFVGAECRCPQHGETFVLRYNAADALSPNL